MTKYYLTKIIYNGLTYFFIWYSNDEDGFLLFNQRLLVFSSVEEANIFADKEHIIFEKGITVFYLSKITELIDNVEISQNCQSLIDTWHLFSDLSKSLNEEFVGDYNDEEIVDIYNKLFYGNKDIILLNKEYCGDVAFVMKKSPSENERYVTTCTCGTPRPEKKIVKNSCTDEE